MYQHWPTFRRILAYTYSPRRFYWRHALWVTAMMLTQQLLRLVMMGFRAADRLFYPRFRQLEVRAPVYILANPRSGTTFLHRLLCLDSQFSYIKLYHTVLPSVLAFKAVDALAWLDEKLGRPFARLVDRLDQTAFQGWDDVHKVGMNRSEEDEQVWQYTLLSPSLMMGFPGLEAVPHVAYVDRMPADVRATLTAYYRDFLQRHQLATGTGKTLLAKNALMAGRLQTCLQAVPDMRIILLVRHPYEAVPSLISMFSMPWKVVAPEAYGATPASRALGELACRYYQTMLEARASFPPDRLVELRYEELLRDPEGVVRTCYARLGLTLSPAFEAALKAETAKSRQYKSGHHYSLEEFGLSREWVYAQMPEVFEAYGFER